MKKQDSKLESKPALIAGTSPASSLSRRQALKAGAIAGAGLLLPWSARRALAASPLDASTLPKYVDALPRIPVMPRAGMVNGADYYEMPMQPCAQKLHRDLPPTRLWGYAGLFPGPTIEARRNHAVKVKWINDLPSRHLFTVDHTIHGADHGAPDVRTVVHLHGAHVGPESDGYPEAWFTRGYRVTGPSFVGKIYHYPNDQRPTTLWYHDHALGITRLNVCAGLAGLYLIRDEAEDALHLPDGRHEIPLLIQDRMLNTDGSLLFPDEGPVPNVHPHWIPEFFGDAAVVNGKTWPFLDVEPRKYRFRVVNGSNSRVYNLGLFFATNGVATEHSPMGPPFWQIGSDGGLLAAPVHMPRLLIAPGERMDVVVDFSGLEGRTFNMLNNAKVPFKGMESLEPDDAPLPEILQIRVRRRLQNADTSVVPMVLSQLQRTPEQSAVVRRDLTVNEIADPVLGEPTAGLLDNKMWDDAITETPRVGETEIWRVFNTTEDVHAIHLHQVMFQVLDRQPFDNAAYMAAQDAGQTPVLGDLINGPALPPEANEMGWKDTVKAYPGTVTRIIVKFDRPGRYVWHCHMLDHEDNEMMRPIEVLPAL